MRVLLLLALAFLGCAHTPKDKTICPEYRDLTCVAGGANCTMDEARGCRVCQCVGFNTYDNSRPENYQGQPDRK